MSSAHQCDAAARTASRDLIHRPHALLFWWLPLAMVIIGALALPARYPLWLIAAVVAGVGCVVNARRCGRMHCRATGPLFLLAALWVALAWTGVVPLHPRFLLVTVGVLFAASFLLESAFGRYGEGRRRARTHDA